MFRKFEDRRQASHVVEGVSVPSVAQFVLAAHRSFESVSNILGKNDSYVHVMREGDKRTEQSRDISRLEPQGIIEDVIV